MFRVEQRRGFFFFSFLIRRMDQIDSGRIVNYYNRLISHEIARPPLGIATTGLLLFMVYYSVFNQFTYFDVGALQTMVIYLPTRLIV